MDECLPIIEHTVYRYVIAAEEMLIISHLKGYIILYVQFYTM